MKGGIACFIAAAARHIAAKGGFKGSCPSLVITGDEEGPAINGTAKLLEWAAAKGESWDAAIVGEPTNPDQLGDMIKIGRRGSISGVDISQRPPGPRRLPAPRRQSSTRADDALRRAARSRPSTTAPGISSRPISKSPRSMSAIPRPTSSRRRRPRYSTSASTTAGPSETLQAEIHNRLDRASRRKKYRAGREEPVAFDLVWRDRAERGFPHPRRKAGRGAERIDPQRDRQDAGTLHIWRHVGRPLHQGLLPGRRVRPGRQDHAHGRRARRAGRPRNADQHLQPFPRGLVRAKAHAVRSRTSSYI